MSLRPRKLEEEDGMEAFAKGRPYQAPTIRELSEDEVLAAFQMSAAEISAAGCWWTLAPSPCT